MSSFLYQCDRKNLVKEKACFKNASNSSCIDFFLTKNVLSFKYTEAASRGLSEYHKLVLTVSKTTISKSKLRGEIHYRRYKKLDSLKFNADLKNAFSCEIIDSCVKLDKIFLKVLNRHALLKKKIVRANHSSYVSSNTLRKAIIRRS